MAMQCPECGSLNSEGANYCSTCGAFLGGPESPPGATTAAYRVGETGEIEPLDLGSMAEAGAALVIRAGGGRTGESFPLAGQRMSIGRRPESDIFLDDVTVSRDHALLVRRGDDWYLDDCGSLNGTYVNRTRIESHRLQAGDELQIGHNKPASPPRLARPPTAPSSGQPIPPAPPHRRPSPRRAAS